MNLRTYLKSKGINVTDFAEESGVSYGTVYAAAAGVAISYQKAKAISEATGGKVKTVDLCEGELDK